MASMRDEAVREVWHKPWCMCSRRACGEGARVRASLARSPGAESCRPRARSPSLAVCPRPEQGGWEPDDDEGGASLSSDTELERELFRVQVDEFRLPAGVRGFAHGEFSERQSPPVAA